MKNYNINERMSIQEIGNRIEKAITLCDPNFSNSTRICMSAFDGHPLWKIVHMCMTNSELDFDYLRKIAHEMKTWQ